MGKIRETEKGRGKALSDYRKVIDDACEFASSKDVPFLFLFVILPLMLMLLDDLVVSFIGDIIENLFELGHCFF